MADFKQVSLNRHAENAWDNVMTVERNGEVPPKFPHKVIMLWRLQRPEKQHELIRLLKFYHIEKTWLEDHTDDPDTWEHGDLENPGSNSDSDDIAQSYTSLEAAVRAHPEIALRALTEAFGMNYDRISKRMSKWEENQARMKEARRIEKRKRDIIGRGLGRNTANSAAPDAAPDTAPNKHRKTDAKRTSPEELSTRLPRKSLVDGKESSEPKSSPQSGSKLGWNVGSIKGSQRRVRDAEHFKAASPSKTPSWNSTVPFTDDGMDAKINPEPDGSDSL